MGGPSGWHEGLSRSDVFVGEGRNAEGRNAAWASDIYMRYASVCRLCPAMETHRLPSSPGSSPFQPAVEWSRCPPSPTKTSLRSSHDVLAGINARTHARTHTHTHHQA